jgi:hypothetical protein
MDSKKCVVEKCVVEKKDMQLHPARRALVVHRSTFQQKGCIAAVTWRGHGTQ